MGRKSAQRIAFYLLRTDKANCLNLARAIVEAREKLRHCSQCNNISANDPCDICGDGRRDRSKICVVEEPFNIYSVERTGLYQGLYHVLLGNLSPIRGIGPDELQIAGLLRRLEQGGIGEVILATGADHRGQRHRALFDRNSAAV